MKVYISTRSLHPPSSGGAFQFTIGIANALSLIPGVRIIAGITAANSAIVGKYFHKDIRTFELDGPGEKVIARSEEAVIAEEDVAWCIYPYPNRHDKYSRITNVKYCSIIYDLQHMAFPGFFSQAERWKREESFGNSILQADLIATISEFSSNEIEQYYPQSRIKPTVIYAGSEISSRNEIVDKLTKTEFLLYPANAWSHKNHEMLFKAFILLKKQHPSLKLILTGDRTAAPETFTRHLKTPGVEHRGYVTSEELSALRARAACVVFPSLYEGFGMPVIESLRQGTPVACSNISSLPEVGGEAAEYFDPTKPDEIADAVERAIRNRDNAIWQQKAFDQASNFSFERSAHLLLDAMKEGDSVATPYCLQVQTQADFHLELGKFWKSYPGVDAILFGAGRSISNDIQPKDLRALNALDTARLDPRRFAILVKKGESLPQKISQWTLNKYKHLLGLVSENKLVVYASQKGVGSQAQRISRLEALRVMILQLRILKRTCRECVIAVLIGRWV